MTMRALPFALAMLTVLAAAPAALAQSSDWPAEKCAIYREAVDFALKRLGPAGIGTAFLERNAAFIASGCTARADVCPRSAQELALADAVIVLGMNRRIASTFFPFACR